MNSREIVDLLIKRVRQNNDSSLEHHQWANELEHELTAANDEELSTPADALNALAEMCHGANARWWHDPATGERLAKRNVGELLMLCVSELAEALEGHRKNLADDKLPHRRMFEVELADTLIRIFDMCGAPELGLNIGEAFVEKMQYNAKRADHTNAARLAPGGKAY